MRVQVVIVSMPVQVNRADLNAQVKGSSMATHNLTHTQFSYARDSPPNMASYLLHTQIASNGASFVQLRDQITWWRIVAGNTQFDWAIQFGTPARHVGGLR